MILLQLFNLLFLQCSEMHQDSIKRLLNFYQKSFPSSAPEHSPVFFLKKDNRVPLCQLGTINTHYLMQPDIYEKYQNTDGPPRLFTEVLKVLVYLCQCERERLLLKEEQTERQPPV